jgi:two-component system OmpR family sensor kinase
MRLRTVSLRARLLAGMVALVAAGLAAAAVVTYEEQRSFLVDRVDQQVGSALVPLSFQLRLDRAGAAGSAALRARRAPGQLPGRRGPVLPRVAANLPPGTFGEVIGSGGAIVRRRTFVYGEKAPAAPALPAHLPVTAPGRPLRLFTVTARGGSGLRYRAAAFTTGGDTAVVAVPLREVDQTLHRLVIVEVLVAGAVILALFALGWLVIRIGLRPLERIGRVASEIAGGNLSKRVTPADGRTEVGRLGRSLNEMLAQIEGAFEDRRRSEERLREFLADASHELRTPLASIRGYAELFRLGAVDDPETLARAMGRIEAEASRMGILVEDLLLLAQLDEPRPLRREPVALRELAEQATADARAVAPDREVQLDAREDPVVLGDPDRLRQLVSNLTRNALIHTPDGSPVQLALERRDGSAVLSVRDHGPGLPGGDCERLFARFWRSHGGRRRGPGGAGLGLPIARAIARAHGGDVTAQDAPGGGARFVVTLPCSADATEGHPQQSLSLLTSDS